VSASRDPAVVAAQLEDLLDDGSILALELSDRRVGRFVVAALLDLDEQPARGIRLGGAGETAVQAREGDRTPATRQAYSIGHLGDRPNARVGALVLRHEQHTLLVAHVDGQRHGHAREDHDVFQRDEQ
jgi:hypothetical protein